MLIRRTKGKTNRVALTVSIVLHVILACILGIKGAERIIVSRINEVFIRTDVKEKTELVKGREVEAKKPITEGEDANDLLIKHGH